MGPEYLVCCPLRLWSIPNILRYCSFLPRDWFGLPRKVAVTLLIQQHNPNESSIICGHAVFYVSSANWRSRLNQQLEWKPNPNPNTNTKVVRARSKYCFRSECPGVSRQLWTIKPGSNRALTTLVLVLGLGLGFHSSYWFSVECHLAEET